VSLVNVYLVNVYIEVQARRREQATALQRRLQSLLWPIFTFL
jgi:hypothetical protein